MERRDFLLTLAAAGGAALAPTAARAEKGGWSSWANYKDPKGKDLGIDFRWTIELFDVNPNFVWFQFRNRRRKTVTFKWELLVDAGTNDRSYKGKYTIAAKQVSAESYRRGNTLRRSLITVQGEDVDPDDPTVP